MSKKLKKRPKTPDPSCEMWMISYADMVTVLLTFFVLMFSMSNVELERFRKAAASLRSAFTGSGIPTDAPPDAALDAEGAPGKEAAGGEQPGSENPSVKIQGNRITIGGKVGFEEGQYRLTQELRVVLDQLVDRFRGVGGRIEIRGHANRNESQVMDDWELSYRRVRAVADYFISRGLDARKVRLAGEGSHRPVVEGHDGSRPAENRRVEIINTEEKVY